MKTSIGAIALGLMVFGITLGVQAGTVPNNCDTSKTFVRNMCPATLQCQSGKVCSEYYTKSYQTGKTGTYCCADPK